MSMLDLGLTDEEKDSILKWFLANGALYQNQDDSYDFKLFNTRFIDIEKPIVSSIVKAQDNLRKSIFM